MEILIITPAKRRSKGGNRATTDRWARFLRGAGHQVREANEYCGESPDLMLALHAWRSADSVRAFSERYPDRPLIVALTGTDVYRFLDSDPATTTDAMARAHALVGLHHALAADIPAEHVDKLHIVVQSAEPAPRRPPLKRWFEACVIGNLRAEKDPLRAAAAARLMPADSRLRVTHLGGAYDDAWAQAARDEMTANPRYQWRGERPRAEVRRVLGRAPVMVISSVMEGGANVVSEAIAAGTPVIASDIPGNRGLLGDDYPGYYPVRDSEALAGLLRRAEQSPEFLDTLRRHIAALAPMVRPQSEADGITEVIARFDHQAKPPG